VDRDRIQRRDFPTGRKGYDIAAVDEHLRRVADAFESNTPEPAPSLAATTSDQVRQILEAAERSVADVHAHATQEASDHVARVQEATTGMLAKLDQLESELNRLLSALRASGERLNQGLAELQAQVAGGVSPAAPEPEPAPELEPSVDGPAPPAAEDSLFALDDVKEDRTDEAGARLVALNMALSGTPREDTALFLAEHFDLPDIDALLDDVYAKAGS
jgi:DivIVA domain-containing protein